MGDRQTAAHTVIIISSPFFNCLKIFVSKNKYPWGENMNIDDVRAQFPLLKHVIYLNSADQAPPGRYWLQAMRESITLYEAGEIEDVPPYGAATHPFLADVFFQCIEKGAELLHAYRDEITNNYRIMTAANMIINDVLTWKRGDNVVFTNLDYPSIPFILIGLRDRGVELRRVEHRNGIIDIVDLERTIDDSTKLVVINRTMPWSDFTYDAKEVTQIAHEHGAIVLDDAFQAVGAIDIDVHRDDIDFLLTGSYKWQCGPEGAGILYVKREIIETIEPKFRNYIWCDYGSDIPFATPEHDNLRHWMHPLVKNANRFEMGTVTTPILFGWFATLDFLLKTGMEEIENRVRSLGDYAYNRLAEEGFKVLTPENLQMRHGLIVYTTGNPKKDAEIYKALTHPNVPGNKKIIVTNRYVGEIGGIRLSTHFFNTKDDIETLLERQKRIAL